MGKIEVTQLLHKLNEANHWEGIKKRMAEMKIGDEDVFFIDGRSYVIAPATVDDVERIGKGYFCID